jgi:hypothetical protein
LARRNALGCVVLCALVASLRGGLGDVAPWPAGHALQIFRVAPPLPNFQPRAQLVADPAGWL